MIAGGAGGGVTDVGGGRVSWMWFVGLDVSNAVGGDEGGVVMVMMTD